MLNRQAEKPGGGGCTSKVRSAPHPQLSSPIALSPPTPHPTDVLVFGPRRSCLTLPRLGLAYGRKQTKSDKTQYHAHPPRKSVSGTRQRLGGGGRKLSTLTIKRVSMLSRSVYKIRKPPSHGARMQRGGGGGLGGGGGTCNLLVLRWF